MIHLIYKHMYDELIHPMLQVQQLSESRNVAMNQIATLKKQAAHPHKLT